MEQQIPEWLAIVMFLYGIALGLWTGFNMARLLKSKHKEEE